LTYTPDVAEPCLEIQKDISLPVREISLFAKQRISLYTNRKRENISAHKKPTCSLFSVCNKGLGLAHSAFVWTNAMLALSGIFEFSAKDITLLAIAFFNL